MCAQALSCVLSFATPWTVALQASLSREFFRQDDWSGLLFPSPGGLPHPGIEPPSPALAGSFFKPPEKPNGISGQPLSSLICFFEVQNLEHKSGFSILLLLVVVRWLLCELLTICCLRMVPPPTLTAPVS